MPLRRVPSRRMHLVTHEIAPMPWRARTWLIVVSLSIAAIVGWGIAALVREVGVLVFSAGTLVLGGYVLCRLAWERRQLRRMADARHGESICSFVRAFDCRTFDTWILRATYERIHAQVGIPLRPSDRLVEDLRIDGDDFGDLAEEVARAAGRSLDDPEKNPWYGRLDTVADVCDFLMLQPKRSPIAA